MAISLGDIKKKKITVSPIKNTNTNNTTYNVAPPVNNQREQQVYNLGDVRKNNITVTPLSERPKSKILAPSPQETMTINSINNKINENISKQIVSGGIQNDIHNMNMANIGAKSNKVTFESAYKDTGKKYGDYYYDNYESFKDKVIYERDGKYFLKTNKGYEPIGKLDKNGNVKTDIEFEKKDNSISKDKKFTKNQDVNLIGKYEEDKKELEKAKNLGYKDNLTKITSKEYDDAQKVLKEYKEQMKMSDKDYKNWLKTGKLPKKHGYFLDGDKTPEKAEDYRVKLLNGEIKKYDQQGFDVEKQIYMDTHNMSDEQKQQYISFITGKELPSNNEKSTFFKGSSVFDDGYQFGDVTKATLGTIGHAATTLAKGIGNFIEGTGDFATNLVGSGLELMTSDKDKKDVTTIKNNVEYTGYQLDNKKYWYDKKNDKLYDENWNRIQSFNLDRFQKQYTYSNGIAEFGRQMKEQTVKDDTSEAFDEVLHGNDLRKASVLGNKSEAMLESMGQALPLMGAGGSVGGLYGNSAAVATTSGLTFSSTYGNAKTEAIRNGATEKEAMETAFVQASAETISEQFFDSIPGAKSAGWGEKLVGKIGKGVENYFGSTTGKIVMKALDISGEGFEEVISNMLTAGGNDIVHYFDKDYNYGMENQTGNILEDMKNAMTSQDSMDSFVSAIITSAILNGGSAKVNSAKTNKIVKAYAQEYNMSFDEAKARLKISDNNIEFDTSNINQTQNTPNLPNNSVVEQRNINNNTNSQTQENVENSMPTIENNTQEKYSNVKPSMVIKYQATDNEKINSFRQSAVKEGMIDSQKTTNAMNVIEKVISDKDYNVRFDRTITNLDGKSVDGKININKNGEVEIALNPNSDRAVEFLLTHEITHAIETNELRGIILDYANKNSEFKSALQDLQKTYGTTNVSDEVIADISGQILGNQEFINSLSMQNTEQSRGFISKVYHSIQRLLNKLTTKGRYRNFVEDLESKWREAYRLATNDTTVNNLKSNSKYAKIYNNDGTVNRIKINDNVFENSKGKSISKTIKDYLTEHIGEVYTIIESGQKVYLGEDLPNEYAHSEYTKKLPLSKKLAKGRTVTNLNEIIESATNRTWEPNKKEKHKIDAKYGFYRYDTTFSFDYNGSEKIYDGTILIRNDANGKKYLYDILNIKPQKKLVNSPLVASNSNKSSAINSGSSNQYINNVPQSNQNVKSGTSTKYSMQTKENNTQELDNSSFSLKEKSTYRGSHQIENAKSIADLDLDEVKNKILDIDGYLTNQASRDFNKLNKIVANPNETVKIYRAAPVNELNNGDWVTTDKAYAKNVADNNGGKVYTYEVRADQLYYPDNIKELPSLHRLSSFQYIENTNIQTTAKDSQGRALSKDQQEYFKDSKIRNDKGELLEVYHGTRSDFTVFDKSYLGSASGDVGFLGDGFYFATHEGEAGYYGSKKMKVYLNVTNPYNIKDLQKYKGMNLRGESSNPYIEIKNLVDMNPEWGDIKVRYGNTYGDIANITDDILNSISVEDLGKTENGHQYKVNIGNDFDIVNTINNYSIDELKADAFTKEMRNKFGFINSSDVIQDITDEARMRKLNNQKPIKTFSEVLEENGYDGVIQGEKASDTDEIVVFNPNQVKNVDNTNPTTNDDIRYSQKSSTWQEHLENNYKATGTRTYFDEITNKKIAPINHNATTNQNKVNPPIAKEYQKNTIEEKKSNHEDVIKVQAEEIANQLNSGKPLNTKERRWIETSTESDILKGKIFKDDLDVHKINYEVQSNKKSLKEANNKLDMLGYDGSINYVKNLIDDGRIPTASDVALAQRTLQEAAKKGDTEVVKDLVMDVAILGTELGQATQALSIINKLTPEGQLKLYSKIVQRAKLMGDKSFQDVEITPEMVEMILNAYDKNGNYNQDDLNSRVEQFKQKVADQLKTSTEEKIDAWRYLSMLGNPKTHIRNIVSNIAMKCAIAYKNAIARTIETFAPINTRTKTWKKASQEIKQYAKETANEMKNVITGESKYGEKASLESKKRIFKFAPLEAISNFNSNALEAEDWFFSKRAFINTFQEYLTANGINTMEDIKNNPDIVEKGKLYAVEQAEIATFRQYSKLASAINKIERNNKVAKYVIKATVPFKKTPINVAKAGVKYSPLGLIKNVTYDVYQVKKGNINASQFIDNLSQGLSGTSLTLLGYALAKAGILTGSVGDDKDDKYDSYLGKQGYSIKIGNKYYSLSWLSPTAMPMFVGANIYEQFEDKKGWDMNVLSESLAKTLDPLNEMSFVSSLTDALNSYGSGNDKIKGMVESVVQSYIGQFFPTLFSQFASVGDDTKRSTKASSNSSYKFGEQTVRSIMYKIPGLRNKLEPSTDIWGNEIKQNENIVMRALESFILPYNAKEYKNSNIDKEIKKVYNNVGNTNVIPGFPQSYVKYSNEQYRMSAKEYTKYKQTYGTSANIMLNMLMNTSNYKNSTDKRKTRMIKKVYDYSMDIAQEEFLSNRNIDYDKKKFKYNKNDYQKIVNYITSSTQYKDDD